MCSERVERRARRLRGVLARRREGRFPDWSPYTHVYRHTSNVLRHKIKFSQKNTTCKLRSITTNVIKSRLSFLRLASFIILPRERRQAGFVFLIFSKNVSLDPTSQDALLNERRGPAEGDEMQTSA